MPCGSACYITGVKTYDILPPEHQRQTRVDHLRRGIVEREQRLASGRFGYEFQRAGAAGDLAHAYGVNLDVVLLEQVLQLPPRIPAAVLLAVGEDQDHLLVMSPLADLLHRRVCGVEQSGAPLRFDNGHAVQERFRQRREILNQLNAVVERVDVELVLRMRIIEEVSEHRQTAGAEVPHRARHIVDYSQRDRGVVIGEERDVLLDIVVENLKVLYRQAGDESTEIIVYQNCKIKQKKKYNNYVLRILWRLF